MSITSLLISPAPFFPEATMRYNAKINLHGLRRFLKHTQKEMAAELHISLSKYGSLEEGRAMINFTLLVYLEQTYGIRIIDFLTTQIQFDNYEAIKTTLQRSTHLG